MPAYPKKWCISWISFFENNLQMEFIYAVDEEAALKEAFHRLTGVSHDDDFNQNIRAAAFDCEGMIEVVCCD